MRAPLTPLHEKFIRETEQTIDTKRKKMELLLEEAEGLEGEITEARRLLHFLKTGEAGSPNGGPPTPASGQVMPYAAQIQEAKAQTQETKRTAQLAITKDAEAKEEKPEKPASHRNRLGRHAHGLKYSDEELVAILQQLPETFSTRDALEVVDMKQSTVDRRMHQLVDRGLAKIVREATFTTVVAGTKKGGSRHQPRLWRVTQAKRNGS